MSCCKGVLFKWGFPEATKIACDGKLRWLKEKGCVVNGLKTIIGTSALKRQPGRNGLEEVESGVEELSSNISIGMENCRK